MTLSYKQLPSPGITLAGVVVSSIVVGDSVSTVEAAVCGTVFNEDGASVDEEVAAWVVESSPSPEESTVVLETSSESVDIVESEMDVELSVDDS